ncbi:RhoGAP domain containing protein [Histomonas meleagridis]|uniref:RhoGAP domain containing protein n=1 Tax=Histomonas meleagridis TaxID=135588 RepID=UPI0035593BC7|nr:RhoGAP domain containing protein [Histomonas meleagridis]KAH0798609.1 RhoGAP domain containing protein [Histomonas meleagridis]
MEEIKVYYQYKGEAGKVFYFDPKTNTSTWEYPEGATVIDPETKEYVNRHPHYNRRRTKTTYISPERKSDIGDDSLPQTRRRVLSNNKPIKASDDDNILRGRVNFNINSEITAPHRINRASRQSVRIPRVKRENSLSGSQIKELTTHNGKPLYYPQEIETDSLGGDISVLFRAINKAKKAQSPTFQTTPITSPISQSLGKSTTKSAILLFKTILKYSGVRPSRQTPGTVKYFIDLVKSEASLVDEAYLQLLKQTNENNHEDAMLKTLQLFTAVVSIFFPSTNITRFVRTHLAKIVQNAMSHDIKQLALFTFIRAISRFSLGMSLPYSDISPSLVNSLPMSYKDSAIQFGVSLQEMMWSQDKNHPNLPIPIFLHYMTISMVNKKCHESQGIFRLPGNMNRVDQMIHQANMRDFSFLEEAHVHDVATLYKNWFKDITGNLINAELTTKLCSLRRDQYVEFADTMDVINRNVLMYLVGFLKEMAQSADKTNMNVSDLAMVFAPNLIRKSDDPTLNTKLAVAASKFIAGLIKMWRTSDVYPLPKKYCI